MELIPVPDKLGRPVEVGELLLDGTGRVYLVEETENSFRRQGIMRVKVAHLARGKVVAAEAHQYIIPQFTVFTDGSVLYEDDLKARKKVYDEARVA